MRIRWWAWVLIVAAVLIVAVAGYRRFYLLPALREPVLRQLKDPDSAKFRVEEVVGDWSLDGSSLCGEVNARTPAGGYAGYAIFYSSGGKSTFYDQGDRMGEIMCGPLRKAELPWWAMRW